MLPLRMNLANPATKETIMILEFHPVSVIGSGYTGKSGVSVVPFHRGRVVKALSAGTLTHERLTEMEAEAYAAFAAAGNFPGYIPTLSRVELEV